MSTATSSPADLAACSREPIHIPGAIQPHGALVVLDPENLRVLQASRNVADFLPLAPPVLGRPLREVSPPLADAVAAALATGAPAMHSPLRVEIGGQSLDAAVHLNDAGVLVELEAAGTESTPHHHRRLQAAIAELRKAPTLTAQHDVLARYVAQITGFDRVMIYRFSDDWHGEVVGEHLSAPVESYLGHHFPASDIPEQARALYRRQWLRLIPDAGYRPVPVDPDRSPRTGAPLDLSGSQLRSVSPVHLEYLRNMGVGASMSVSLIVRDQLWGLIACHHRTPRHLPFAVRASCELMGQIASLEIASREERHRLAEHVAATRIQTKFFEVIGREPNVVEALVKYTPELLEFMGATGAVIHVNDQTTPVGLTPDPTETAALLAWVEQQPARPVFATHRLPELFPPARDYPAVASGLLALRLSAVESHYILWFRPEVLTTITWAGPPEKSTDAEQRIHPRKSFAAWKQTVTGESLPWSEAELAGSRELVQAINALVLRRTERLLTLNAELERKNSDLNSFAYIAAHDLKEPLRGLSNYCQFLREDHGPELSTEALRKLDTMTNLVNQSEQLIEALNHYSRIGRIEIDRKETALDGVVDDVLTSLEKRLHEHRVTVRRTCPLPVVSCDPVLVREVFLNLFTNAIRYNTRPDRWIEIGATPGDYEGAAPILFVRDNGIGIRDKHIGVIFNMFRRLHAHADFGGGTGAGLAIVKSIVERHGGRIWAESVYGEGTTFRFTLG